MKLGRKAILFGMLILIGSIFIAVPVQAEKTRTTINFVYYLKDSGDPIRFWITKDNILHMRGTPHDGYIDSSDSDFTGDIYYTGNINLDLNIYEGSGGGIFEFNGECLGAPASFSGRLNFILDSTGIYSTFTLHGTGSLQGLLKGTSIGLGEHLYAAELVIWT